MDTFEIGGRIYYTPRYYIMFTLHSEIGLENGILIFKILHTCTRTVHIFRILRGGIGEEYH